MLTATRVVPVMLWMVLVACATPAPQSAGPSPRLDQGGPDADEYGARASYPVGDRTSFFRVPFLVGSQSHQDEIFPSRVVRRATTPSPLARAASEPALRYEYQGQTLGLDDYLARNPATGLLVARDDTIFVERYQYARTDRDRFTSWSMAKTVTSMLIGRRRSLATATRPGSSRATAACSRFSVCAGRRSTSIRRASS